MTSVRYTISRLFLFSSPKLLPLFLVGFLLFPSSLFAFSHPVSVSLPFATLSLFPSQQTYGVNDTVSLELTVSSSQPVTSIKSYLSYNPSLLYLSSIETQNSDFPYWWEASSKIDNPTGKVMLQASASAPGITKPTILIAKLNFRAIKQGTTTLFLDPSSLVLTSSDMNILNLSQSKPTTLTIQGTSSSSSFSRNLQQGDQGTDVKLLQQHLNSKGFLLTNIPGAPGSPGYETDLFGPLTHQSLIHFQEAYASQILHPLGLTTGTGYFGPATRAYITASMPTTRQGSSY